MNAFKSKLLSSTVIPMLFGTGIVVGGAMTLSGPAHAVNPASKIIKSLPVAKKRPAGIRLAACKPCNPCAAKKGCNPCNPCAAKKGCNPCNPCAVKKACNPCNPCGAGAGGGSASMKCAVPRLVAAWKSNPCAAKKACNPCNPCAAKKNPCNPCAAKNPCNPCGGAQVAEVSPAEARAVYDCLKGEMKAAYAKSGLRQIKGYTNWLAVNNAPYQSGTHGGRYVNNYADTHGDYRYKRFEKSGTMPLGSVLAKDSFVVRPDGKVTVGPMFVMEKMNKGFNKASFDWRYTLIMPNGQIVGATGGKGSANMKFCYECHVSVADDQDSMMFAPDEFRKKF